MTARPLSTRLLLRGLVIVCVLLLPCTPGLARPKAKKPTPQTAKAKPQDDCLVAAPAKDLLLDRAGQRKAEALAQFVEGERLEEMGEMEKALDAYQKVLTIDPGRVDLACHVAALLEHTDNYPLAIDVLKDAIKASPKEAAPYLQLAVIYAKELKKLDQALKYANQAAALDPENIEAYQRIFEIEIAAGHPAKALEVLDRALKVKSSDAAFWVQVGKLFAATVLKTDSPKPEDVARVNAVFKKAGDLAGDDSDVLKDVADYFASSRQIEKAIPYYLKVLEIEPDDLSAQEKLANGFVVTNQWPQAVGILQQIIKAHPERAQPYELLAGVYEDEARSFERTNESEKAKSDFAKAAQNYEQSLLINPTRATNYLHLAELLLGRLRQNDRAVRVLTEARRRFPNEPEFTYYLAIALREAKKSQEAVATFEEALHEAELSGSEMVNARFYFDYGATAEQAGFYDKAADLFKRSIALDPGNAAEAYNYLGFMWADHNMHLEEAAQMIHQALELDPNNGAYLDSLGWLYYRQGKYEDALRELLKAAQNLTKPDPTVFDHIGDAYAKLNRMAQALDYWQKSATLDPDNKALAQKIESTKTKLSRGAPARAKSIR